MINTNKIYVYGAGNMGRATIKLALLKNKVVNGIIDRNKDMHGKFIYGIRVRSLEEFIGEAVKDYVLVVAISAVPFYDIKNELTYLGFSKIISSGDYLTQIGYKSLVNIWRFTKPEAEECLLNFKNLFSDKLSYVHFNAAIGWFENRKENIDEKYLSHWDRNKYFPELIKKLISPTDTLVDAAFLSGEYVKNFFEVAQMGSAAAFNLHPSSINIKEIDLFISKFSGFQFIDLELGERSTKETVIRCGIMEPFVQSAKTEITIKAFDDFKGKYKCDYFRGYSMSPIIPILKGAKRSFDSMRPIIAINIGHYKNDFMAIGSFVRNNYKYYDYYFRMHSFQGNDCILYAVPKEKNTNECD